MKIGISTFPTDYSPDVAAVARRAEELGFESLWVPEHVMLPVASSTKWPGSTEGVIPKVYADIADPFVALARASGVTERLMLGTAICLVPERNPLLLAKEVASLDMFSGGRFLFGIGAGWLREELELLGGDFDRRWGQTREAVLAMKELWTRTKSEFHGEFYDFPPVYSFPRPVQRPHPPVLLGGMAERVFKRVVEWGDGWIPNRVTPAEVGEGRARLNALAQEAGRDPSSIEITISGQPPDAGLIEEYGEVGADRVIVRLADVHEDQSLDELDRIAEAVLT